MGKGGLMNKELLIKQVIDKVNYLNSPQKNCTYESRILHAIKVSLLEKGVATCNYYMHRFIKARAWLHKLEKLGIIRTELHDKQIYAILVNREEFEKRYSRDGRIPNDYKKLF